MVLQAAERGKFCVHVSHPGVFQLLTPSRVCRIGFTLADWASFLILPCSTLLKKKTSDLLHIR